MVLSPYVVDEAPRHIARLFPEKVKPFEVLLQLLAYEEVATPGKAELEQHADLVRDPAYVPVALSAINAQVYCLITQDRDFTDRDASTEELHRRLTVVLPGTFLREYMNWTSEQLGVIRRRTWSDLE